jgi:hypothetical protein
MKKIITVDFDHTLAAPVYEFTGWISMGTGGLKPVKEVVDFIEQKVKEGYEIHIVTFRENIDVPEVKDFIKEHKLPIKNKNIHNTCSKSKTPILKNLNSCLHLDDSLSVCVGAFMEGIPCMYIDSGQRLDKYQKHLLDKMQIMKVNFYSEDVDTSS